MATNTTQVGERKSFYQLFIQDNYKIEIPIIQRDYAQGRESKSEVRELFLQALYDYLEDNIPNRDLDFVYGSTEKEEAIEKFIPLDGQQRLTTLFLLHWYLANISGNLDEFKAVMFEDNKSKFTYLTRSSSSEFCDALLKNDIDIKNLLISEKTGKESIAETIKDTDWYFLSWSKDPTIQSMLIMLDAIHIIFKDKPHYFERLIDLDKPKITFLYLDLGKYGLTEDLYIKMNSRGKPLTTFENFKAKLEQHIEKLFLKDKKRYPLVFDDTTKEVDTKEYFSFNIDTKWANLFWQYRELAGNKNTFDDEIMNFVCIIASNKYAIENSTKKENYTAILKRESNDNVDNAISFYKLNDYGALTKSFVEYLINALDCLSNDNHTIKIHLENNFYFNENEIFRSALKNNLSRVERIKFHSYLRYLIINGDNLGGLHQWMRVVHNLTENTEIDDNDKEIKAFLEIESLLPNSNRILDYLIENQHVTDAFFDRQVQEETIKAHLINKSDQWKTCFELFECTEHFKGQLLFLLEFSGILEYFEINNNCNWTNSEDEKFFADFNTYGEKALAFFNLIQTPLNSNYLLERAVLTKGDYLIPSANNRCSFLSSNKVNNYLRDYSWRSLLQLSSIDNSEEDLLYWKEKRNFVKNLFDDSQYQNSNVPDSLNKIIKNTPVDWRKYFVTNPELIRYCELGFVKFINENNITLLLRMNENSRMREMFTYNLFTNEINDPTLYSPFEDIFHQEINRECEESFVHFRKWVFKQKQYSLKVNHETDDSGENGFFAIVFTKDKGTKEQLDYNDALVQNLLENKFKWVEDLKHFKVKKSNETATLKFIKNLCEQLTALTNE